MKRAAAIVLAMVFSLVMCEAAFGQTSFWWDRNWQAKRVVSVESNYRQYEGDDVGWVEFPTLGLTKPDGSDIRVVYRQKEIPSYVMSVGPGDVAKVCFPLIGGAGGYQIYFGNPQAPAPQYDWEPKRGLLMTVRQYRGGAVDNLEQMRATIARSSPVIGAGFVDRVFLGFNPFGPSINFTSEFTGWLKCPESGMYTFTTSSDDASFLLIDGKLVTSAPGWHGARGDIKWSGTTNLTAGVHKFEYLHCQGGGASIMVAAWKPPTAEKVVIIDSKYFLPANEGKLATLELLDKPVAVDFRAQNLGFAPLDADATQFVVKMGFENLTRGSFTRFTWDFGDGITDTARTTSHVYLKTGIYNVTLTGAQGGREFSTTMRVAVEQDWTKQTSPKINKLTDFFRDVRSYAVGEMSPGMIEAAFKFYMRLDRPRDAVQLAEEAVASEKRIPDDALYAIAVKLANLNIELDHAYSKALAVCTQAEAKITNPEYKALLNVEMGTISLVIDGEEENAKDHFTKVLEEIKNVSQNTMRKAYIGMGDYYRWRGDMEKVLDNYTKAAALPIGETNILKQMIKRGAYPRTIDGFLQDNDPESARAELDQFLWEFPQEKAQGYAALLTARVLAAEEKYDEALKELITAYRFNPDDSYAADLLYAQGELYLKLHRTAQAIEVFEIIESAYQESRLYGKARKLLFTLNPQREDPVKQKGVEEMIY